MGYYSDLAHNLQRKNERLKKENERLEKEKKENKEFKKLFIFKKGEYVCTSKISVKPIAHYYGKDEWNGYEYYKYSCPICDSLGCKHQVPKGQKNCLICRINLEWELAE